MNRTHHFLKGTLLLTSVGILTKLAGFFFKIFLSRTIGAEEIGLFQLCMPLYAFGTAAAAGGIQTVLSRLTAELTAKKEPKKARSLLFCALFLTLVSSAFGAGLLFFFSSRIADGFLHEPRCAAPLRLLALSLPFSSIHACICGYYTGKRQVTIPAVSQLLEQSVRILSVLLLFRFWERYGTPNAAIIAFGMLTGELAAVLSCLCIRLHRCSSHRASRILHGRFSDKRAFPTLLLGTSCAPFSRQFFSKLRFLNTSALPLSLTRMLLCVLQAIETALLPQQLRLFGLHASAALSVCGIINGMVLPLLLFPSVLTGSASLLLLPLISESHALQRQKQLRTTAHLSLCSALLLGIFFSSVFLLFGESIGTLLFAQPYAGVLLRQTAFLCPFLYLDTLLTSILHGLGKTASISACHIFGSLLRLLSVLFLIPHFGILGYLCGCLCSQLIVCAISWSCMQRCCPLSSFFTDFLLKPVLLFTSSCGLFLLLHRYLLFPAVSEWGVLLLSLLIYSVIFLLLVICLYPSPLRRPAHAR